MAKSNEEKLRRQLEILKAQVKSNSFQRTAPQHAIESKGQSLDTEKANKVQPKQTSYTLDFTNIKAELNKTLIFSIIMAIALFTLYLTESKWINLIKFI